MIADSLFLEVKIIELKIKEKHLATMHLIKDQNNVSVNI